MLTNEELSEIFEQADCIINNITPDSIHRIYEVCENRQPSAAVFDIDGSFLGAFTAEKLREEWDKIALEHGWDDGDAFYRDSGEHDAGTYDLAVQLAICGEVVYG